MDHTIRFTFADAAFNGANGYALGLAVKEARVWCAAQGLVEDVDFTFNSTNALRPYRYIDWIFRFADPRAAALFKIRFSHLL